MKLIDICDIESGLWKGKKSPLIKVKVIRNTNFETGGKLNFDDIAEIEVEKNQFKKKQLKFGDIILGRRDITASYHLSVVLDDADSNIEVVTRGEDLRQCTDIHSLLQKLLGLPSPLYFHHPVILGEDGKKLSKGHKSPSLNNLRDEKITLRNILRKELVINF